MADISKCHGKDCEIKEICYRFTAPSSYHQWYSDYDLQYTEQKLLNPNAKCENYWDNKGRIK